MGGAPRRGAPPGYYGNPRGAHAANRQARPAGPRGDWRRRPGRAPPLAPGAGGLCGGVGGAARDGAGQEAAGLTGQEPRPFRFSGLTFLPVGRSLSRHWRVLVVRPDSPSLATPWWRTGDRLDSGRPGAREGRARGPRRVSELPGVEGHAGRGRGTWGGRHGPKMAAAGGRGWRGPVGGAGPACLRARVSLAPQSSGVTEHLARRGRHGQM